MNPLITLGTFFARLTTFPRMVLYIAAQLAGASLAGLLLRSAADTRFFKVGGCYLFTDMTSVQSAFTIEFVGSLLLLFLAFGVGLDPRQAEMFGPALGPVLVGLAAGSTALSLSFAKPGYGGAALNPARCFGVFVGSRFPSWAWVTWVAPLAASLFHGVVYFLVPPVTPKGKEALIQRRVGSDVDRDADGDADVDAVGFGVVVGMDGVNDGDKVSIRRSLHG